MKLKKEELSKLPNKGGIYLFTNTVNNKCYVGQTICLRKRLQSHLNNFITKRYDNPLYRALEKYGIEVFEVSILEIVENDNIKETLDILEIKYIEKYDSYHSGYNQTLGADGGILGYKMTEEQIKTIRKNAKDIASDGRYTVYCMDLKTKEIISSPNMMILSDKSGFNAYSAKNAKAKKRPYLNRYYFASSLDEFENLPEDIIGTPDDYLMDYYKYIMSLDNPTITNIAKELGLSRDTINKRHAKLKRMGYSLPTDKGRIKGILVKDIEMNSEELLSVIDCAKKFGISDKSIIRQARRGGIYKKHYSITLVYED